MNKTQEFTIVHSPMHVVTIQNHSFLSEVGDIPGDVQVDTVAIKCNVVVAQVVLQYDEYVWLDLFVLKSQLTSGWHY